MSYDVISRLFSAKEGRTIEKYHIAQKIERVKELLDYLNVCRHNQLFLQTSVKCFSNRRFVQMLAYEHEFDHTVAVFFVPVSSESWILLHHGAQLFLGGGRIPQSGLS